MGARRFDGGRRSVGTKRSPLPCCATCPIDVVDVGKLCERDAEKR
ncbi:hypothetical protein BURMUCGD2M_5598 [Burkholderia multivorans CGD2M]|uniref:Uncharacterized protein n=1 Tax=Burkholderia multivorans CGD2 TaxID=513052 RepID=B9BKJ9_9BURK|nr:hypothetical protein BURMUCGD2_5607 [Burkholderia multivorans CGD2]EEE16153.1 hypothetical protein BURMUCGD2M_5598 [Burkholderia multivorans CGD2M]